MMKKISIIPGIVGFACILFFGVFAIFLGQDTSWDTRNYHVYNPYAFLTDRIAFDLAPAQLQSYFSPVIDLPVYWLTQHLQPWSVGFGVGGIQGLNALLIFLIGRELLTTDSKTPLWTPLLLAGLGCMNASFVAQLGTAAGDSTSSIFVLCALYLVCNRYALLVKDGPEACRVSIWTGLLMGVAVGLKLTNAPFAIAMAIIFVVFPHGLTGKFRQAVTYGFSVLVSFSLISGWWFYKIWINFGNPLFPQFNSFFKSELASATSVIDTRWGPVSGLEAIFWPFWMSFRPWRIHDAPLYNYLWILAYFLLIALVATYFWRFFRDKKAASSDLSSKLKNMSPAFSVLVFIAVSYLIWLKIFSIGRYVIALEVLLPLFIYLGSRVIVKPRVALVLTIIFSFFSLMLGLKQSNFGVRAAWADKSYHVDVPYIENSSTATILIAADGEPNSWLLQYFPSQTAVLRVSGNFPRSLAYDNRVRQILATRGGSVYVILSTPLDWSLIRSEQLNYKLGLSTLTEKPSVCNFISKVVAGFDSYKNISIDINADGYCRADVKSDIVFNYEKDADYIQKGDIQLAALGYKLLPESCATYKAFVGRISMPYQFCEAIYR